MLPRYTILRTRYIPAVWPIYTYWLWSMQEFIGLDKGTVINSWQGGNYTGIWETNAINVIGRHVIQNLLGRIDQLDAQRERGIEAGKKVVDLCRTFAEQDTPSSLEAYLAFFQDFCIVYEAFMKANMVYWIFSSEPIEERLNVTLASYSEEDCKEIMRIMSTPLTFSYSQIEELAFEELLQLARRQGLDSPETQTAIRGFSEQYAWFPYEYVGPEVWTEERVRERVREQIDKSTAPTERHDISEEQRVCIEHFHLPETTVKLFRVLQLLTLMQDDRKMLNAQVCFYLDRVVMQRLADYLGVPIEHARYMDLDLLKLFPQDAPQVREHLAIRSRHLVLTQSDQESRFYEGEAALAYLRSQGVNLVSDASQTTLRGRSAYPGQVRGIVRILRTSSHVENFQEGTILVTGMTTPDFVTYLKKAGAIITDEGGITCHAAIVSRELQKPCIIGTKDATRVLRDGDEVEVNAHEGVVTILRRAV